MYSTVTFSHGSVAVGGAVEAEVMFWQASIHCGIHSLRSLEIVPESMNESDMVPNTTIIMGIAAPCAHAHIVPISIHSLSLPVEKRN